MVFQDPLSSLDPCLAVGDQIAEVHRIHSGASRRSRARPHEFSGGRRRRMLVAMALAPGPGPG